MLLAYTAIQGKSKTVQQNALITVRGSTVTIKGSNPDYVLGSGHEGPDPFTMIIGNPGPMGRRYNDAAGAGGSLVINTR